jgi:hypothetical protein
MGSNRTVIGKEATIYAGDQVIGTAQDFEVDIAYETGTTVEEVQSNADALQKGISGSGTLSLSPYEPCRCEARRKLYKNINRQDTGYCYICKSIGIVSKTAR